MSAVVPLAGRYRFLRKLQGASSGVVWLAADDTTGGSVVAASVTSARIDGLVKGAGLQHDHLATLLDVMTDVPPEQIPGRIVLPPKMGIAVATDVSGRALQDRLDLEKPLPVHQAVRLTYDIVRALAHLHLHGAVHGAVSARNVVIASLAGQAVPVLTNLRVSAVGNYCCPERIGGEGPSQRDDVWAMCVLLFAVLTARLPFEGQSPEQLYKSMTAGQIPQLAHFGIRETKLQNVINRGFCANSQLRFANAQQMLVVLEKCVSSSSKRDSRADLGLPTLVPDADVATNVGAASMDRNNGLGAVRQLSVGVKAAADNFIGGEIDRKINGEVGCEELEDDEMATVVIDTRALRKQLSQQAGKSVDTNIKPMANHVAARQTAPNLANASTVSRGSRGFRPEPRLPGDSTADISALAHSPKISSLADRDAPITSGQRACRSTMMGLAPLPQVTSKTSGSQPLQPVGFSSPQNVPVTGSPSVDFARRDLAAEAASPTIWNEDDVFNDEDCKTEVFNPDHLAKSLAAVGTRKAVELPAPAGARMPSVAIPNATMLQSTRPSGMDIPEVNHEIAVSPAVVTTGADSLPAGISLTGVEPVASVAPVVAAASPTRKPISPDASLLAVPAPNAVRFKTSPPGVEAVVPGKETKETKAVLVSEVPPLQPAAKASHRGVFFHTLMRILLAAFVTVFVALIAFFVVIALLSAPSENQSTLSLATVVADSAVDAVVAEVDSSPLPLPLHATDAVVEDVFSAFTDSAPDDADTLVIDADALVITADGATDGDAEAQLEGVGAVGLCAMQFFPEKTFNVPVSMDFLCEGDDYQAHARRFLQLLVQGANGMVTDAMRTWSLLGWFEVAVIAVLRENCCEGMLGPITEQKSAKPCRDIQQVLYEAATGRCSEEAIEQRTKALAVELGCYYKNKMPRPYSYPEPIQPHNRVAFSKFLAGIQPSRCER